MLIGHHQFDFAKQAYIMGILNVTPDSFSDGGRYTRLDQALFQAEKMVREGADLLDIGGESTRPGYERISWEEETRRVVPVIEGIKRRFDIPVSLDTCKPQVAAAGIRAGADLINDIWGLQGEPGMAELIARHELPCVLMHNRMTPAGDDFFDCFDREIEKILQTAREAGIREDRIILDPGVGFGKTYHQNLQILHHLERMQKWRLPVLLGVSRKSVIGRALSLPTEEREEGTAALTVLGRMKGAGIFRVHDVKTNRRALKMTEAVLNEDHE